MDDHPDIDGQAPAGGITVGAALEWQSEHFPHVAAWVGGPVAGFASLRQGWDQDGGTLDALLAYQTRFAGAMDARIQAAHLIAYYSHHLAIVAGTLYLQAGIVCDLSPDRLSMRFDRIRPDGAVQTTDGTAPDAHRLHFRLSPPFGATGDDTAFHDAFVGSLIPVVDALQMRTGLSTAAQWRLAADGLAGAFLDIGVALGQAEPAMAAALAIVGQAQSPLFSGTLHFEAIEGEREGLSVRRIFRMRSGCCLYYRTPGGDFCDVCVLLEDETRRRRLRATLERAGG